MKSRGRIKDTYVLKKLYEDGGWNNNIYGFIR